MDLPIDYQDELEADWSSHLGSSLNRSRDSAKSIESLNTLLMSLPEISIPALEHSPLPLQCLAASALPPELRSEIDGVIARYASCLSASNSEEHLDTICAEQVQLQQEPSVELMADNATLVGNSEPKDAAGEVVEPCAPAQQVSA